MARVRSLGIPLNRDRRVRLVIGACALAIAVLALGLSQIPHAWGLYAEWRGTYPEKTYSGFPHTYGDEATTYMGWIRQAAEGHFLLHDRLTPEEHPRNYINILFWTLGQVVRWTGLSTLWVYSASRVLLAILLMVLYWRLARLVFQDPPASLACFLFLVVSGGWEGLAGFLERNFNGPHVSSPAWWTPQISTFFSMMLFPHLLASFVFMVLTVLCLAKAWTREPVSRRQRDTAAAAAGLAMTILTMFHPFDAFTMAAVLWMAPLLFWVAERRLAWEELRVSLVATAVWLPSLLYNIYIFLTNPVLRWWNQQNIMTSSDWDRLIIASGISGVLAVVALFRIRHMSRAQIIMVAWIIAVPILISAPVRFQRRMLGGVQIPLAVLAVAGLLWLASMIPGWWARKGWGTLALAVLIFPLQVLTPYYLLDIEWRAIQRFDYPCWLWTDVWQTMDHLDGLADEDDVILASYELGNFVPWRTGARAFLGHYALTADAKAKEELVRRFYSQGREDDGWRKQLLEDWRVTYVLDTPHERELGGFDPSTSPWLREVFRSGEGPEASRIYQVVSEPAGTDT